MARFLLVLSVLERTRALVQRAVIIRRVHEGRDAHAQGTLGPLPDASPHVVLMK